MSKLEIFEKVGPGHPDKVADQIADTFCSIILNLDINAKVACEVMIVDGKIIFGGELKVELEQKYIKLAMQQSVEKVLKLLDINKKYFIYNKMQKQSNEINEAVELENEHIGAGDQGICIGYACRETTEHLPKVQVVADYIIKEITKLIKTKQIVGFGYDMKLLLTLGKFDSTTNWSAKQIIFAIQHDKSKTLNEVRTYMRYIISKLLYEQDVEITPFTEFIINAGGTFHKGGSDADTGLTGRKIACDNFANCSNGGGAFSGKDWTKVDRTGTYLARYIANNVLYHNPYLNEVIVKLVYAIGQEYPKIYINGAQNKTIKLKPLYKIIDIFKNKMCYSLDEITMNHWIWDLPWEEIEYNKGKSWILNDN